MNSLIEALNEWAELALRFAWPMLWQSSLLIGLLLILDLLLKRRVRASVRYALWLLVLVKLVLPPSLALPTSAGWWLRPAQAAHSVPLPATVAVSSEPNAHPIQTARLMPALMTPAPPRLSVWVWTLAGTAGVSLGLLVWMLVRWVQVARDARRAAPGPEWLADLVPERQPRPRLRLTHAPRSPAVCGLFRPVILLPHSLAEQLAPAQLRAVLLHEWFHLRRGDVWVNCAQALLQIAYWWHPLLWLANARIRRVREEAVDDAVMLALDDEADTYAPTLLEVAKLALKRPLASLGLVGILESRSALRQRIERLLDSRPPRKAGLGLASALGVLGFAVLAVPMGEAPAPSAGAGLAATQAAADAPASSAVVPAADEKAKGRELEQDGKLLYEMGKLEQAKAKLTQAVEKEPQSQAAAYYLQLVNEALARADKSQPPGTAPPPRTNTLSSAKGRALEQDGKLLYEMGKLEEAKAKLTQAVKQDPQSQAAAYYLQLVNEALAQAAGSRPMEDYPVVFSVRTNAAAELYTRSMKVDPHLLAEALGVPAGPNEKNGPASLIKALQERLAKEGADLDPVRHPGKALFLNDRLGMLLVRTTNDDLDVIERVIATLNTPVPQIHIQAKFIELLPADAKALGFDWYLGNLLMTGSGRAAGTNPEPSSSNLTPAGSMPPTLTGILTPPQYQRVVTALQQRQGTEVIAQPEVTSLSGRQVQCKVTELHTVLMGIDERALKPPGLNGTNVAASALYRTAQVESGPVLGTMPTVLEDGYTLRMPVTLTLAEFRGYEESPTNRVTVYVNGKPKEVSQPRPILRASHVTSLVDVRDGQTLVLGGLVSERIVRTKDSVPVLGDVPLIGKLFRRESTNTEKRQLLIFITPTIVDSAGNRVHNAGEVPSDVPPQPML